MRHWIIAIFGLFALGVAPSAWAQSQPTPPERYALDPHGVDLVTGNFVFSTTEVVIGSPGAGGLTYGRTYLADGSGWRDSNATVATPLSSGNWAIEGGLVSEEFVYSGGNWVAKNGDGATLTIDVAGSITVTDSSGGVSFFDINLVGSTTITAWGADVIPLTTYTAPNGETLVYHYTTACAAGTPPLCLGYQLARVQSITNNRGYQLKYEYWSNDGHSSDEWMRVKKVSGINNAIDYCDPDADSCGTLTQTWPSVNLSNQLNPTTSTDQSSRTTTYGYYGDRLSSIRYPGSSVDDVSLTYGMFYRASSVTDASGTWNYTYTDISGTRFTVASGPLSQQTTAQTLLSVGRPFVIGQRVSASPPVNQFTYFTYDADLRPLRTTNTEGDYVEVAYDGRGNITTMTAAPKPGSGLSNIAASANYPTTCANPVTCNLPTSTTDERGNVTDYAWNSAHGGLESITLPAPAIGAVRPQTRITYGTRTAYLKNSSGVIVAAASSIVLPTSGSTCATGSAPACLGTSDETRISVVYGSTGVANNLLPTSTTSGDGSGSLAVTNTVVYDHNGDPFATDGPLAGVGDYTRYRYNAARQLVGVVGPDPDLAGGLLNRAQRITYNARGQVTLVEAGTTPGWSDGDWASFATLQRQQTDYDSFGRLLAARQQDAAGATLALQQVSYDAAGRTECSATRMNPGVFAGLPAATGACSMTAAGAFGPDRITQVTYDAAGRPLSTINGVGSGSTITEAVTYTANGLPFTLTDGSNNRSTMVYDGFDRLSRLRYPDTTAGSGTSSTTDYEDYGYDAASHVTYLRNRAGQTFGSFFDDLGRLGSIYSLDTPATFAQRYYAYDNLNRPLYAHTPTATPWAVYWWWDALGRKTAEHVAETSAAITTSVYYGYDAASRRVSMTWPDGYYAAYDWDYGNDLTAIRENGSTVSNLAAYGYDNLGRRVWMNRGNGANTGYGYDGLSRLTYMLNDLTGTSQDVTYGLSYNPASQIVSRSVSNDLYVHTPTSGSTTYTNDGLNRVNALTGSGATSIGYDGKQNITTGLGATYAYDGLSQLTAVNPTSGPTFAYDPTGRLYRSTGSATRRYLYDDVQAIAEYDGTGAMVSRYVPGLGLDDVVTSYAGSGTSSRTWLLGDERQSVIGLTDGSGVATTINTYDEYGVPGSGNAGRFQYTGQMWFPDAGIYHYRARAYAPQIGRFLQTDPLGYVAGMNLYAYVANDPVNWRDPLGLQEVPTQLPPIGPVTPQRRPIVSGRTSRGEAEPTLLERLTSAADRVEDIVVVASNLIPGRQIGWRQRPYRWSFDSDGVHHEGYFTLPEPTIRINVYASNRAALRAAKRAAGVPYNQSPFRIRPNVNRQGQVVPGRVMDYRVGNRVVSIRQDAGGHTFSDGGVMGPHYNVVGMDGTHFGY